MTQKLFPFCTRQNFYSPLPTFRTAANTQHYLYRKIAVVHKSKGVTFVFLSGTPEVYTAPVPTHTTSSHGPHQPPQHNNFFYSCTITWVKELTHTAHFISPPGLSFSVHTWPDLLHNHMHIRATGRRQQHENASGNDRTQEWAASNILPKTHVKEITVKVWPKITCQHASSYLHCLSLCMFSILK